MEDLTKIKKIVEALIMISETGVTGEDLLAAIPEADMKDIEEAVNLLTGEYSSMDRSFSISKVAGRYRVITKPEYMPWISNLYHKEIERLTGPSLETLAILAYKQPATRTEIETVRGVNSGGVLKALLDRELVRVKGRRDTIGRPLVYETTEKFLELFGLSSIDELPKLREFEESELEYGKPDEKNIVSINSGEDEGELKNAAQDADVYPEGGVCGDDACLEEEDPGTEEAPDRPDELVQDISWQDAGDGANNGEDR